MTDSNEAQIVSTDNRGGFWFPVVLTTIGVGIVLSGIFTGATGLYGDDGSNTWSDGFREAGRELARLVLFSLLFFVALRINCWRIRRPLGNVLLAALRCVAIIALIEAVRVAQIPSGVERILLISAVQYLVCSITVFLLFSMTTRETVLFVSWCTVATALLWVGAHLGIWIA